MRCLASMVAGVAVVAATTVLPAVAAAAASNGECGAGITCVAAVGGSFVGSASSATGAVAGGAASTGGGGPGPAAPVVTVVVEQRIAPACSGNSPYQDAILCMGAVSICATPGDVAYWVWTRQVDLTVPGQDPPWHRTSAPPYVCYGPGSPVISRTDAIAGLVQRDFGTYPLPRGRLRTEPGGATLVNLQTNVYTDAVRDETFTVTLLGQPVVITAHAQQWTWHFGDGNELTTDSPGRRGSLDIPHDYRRAGRVAPYVVIEWSGTYRPPGAATALPVRGTATTTGPVSGLDVRQARSQYQGG